jgi:hypothetical protein
MLIFLMNLHLLFLNTNLLILEKNESFLGEESTQDYLILKQVLRMKTNKSFSL